MFSVVSSIMVLTTRSVEARERCVTERSSQFAHRSALGRPASRRVTLVLRVSGVEPEPGCGAEDLGARTHTSAKLSDSGSTAWGCGYSSAALCSATIARSQGKATPQTAHRPWSLV